MRPAGMKRPLALFTAFLKVFSACSTVCFASFCKVFVAGFSIRRPVRFLEVDVGSSWPFNHRQFGVDGDEDGQIIAGQ